MIDILKAKQEFKKYVKKYDINDKKIKLKIAHIMRTAENSRQLAEELKLEKEDIELAELIGLLHDIGRFEQIRIYHTFYDKESINHAEYGVKVLFEDNLIRNFVQDDRYDSIIKTAILNHNRNKENVETSNEKEELHSKIIRDADKTDILYLLTFDDIEASYGKSDYSKDKMTDKIYNDFMNSKSIDYSYIETVPDKVITNFAYIYDINYNYTLRKIYENKYIEKIYKRVIFKNEETIERYNKSYEKTINHMKKILDRE